MKLQKTFIAGPDQLRSILNIFGIPTSWPACDWTTRFGEMDGQDLGTILEDSDLADFLKYLMKMNPKERATASEALQHSFCNI